MVFPTFFNLSMNLVIRSSWPVSSWSYFCWLYRDSLSLAAKNIINLILVLTIWWCPCVESSLVLLEDGIAMTSAFSWQNCKPFSSVQFSRSVVSASLWLHKSQHARPPCPSPSPRVHSDSRPSSPWCHPAISSYIIPFSSCLQSFSNTTIQKHQFFCAQLSL